MRPDALILGTGGASKAVGYVLRELGIAYTTVSRSGARQALLQGLTAEVMHSHPLIVNATPLGTFPKVAGCPALPYETITPAHFLFDLVYNPPRQNSCGAVKRREPPSATVTKCWSARLKKAWEIWNDPAQL